MPAGAGQDEITKSGQAGQCRRADTFGTCKARQFGKASGDQGSAGAVAKLLAVANAAGDGQDVLHCAAQLNAFQIGTGIDAESRERERFGNPLCGLGFSSRNRYGGWQAAGDIGGKAWAGQDRGHQGRRHFAQYIAEELA